MRRAAWLLLLLPALAGCADTDWTGAVARSLESTCRNARNCTVRSGADSLETRSGRIPVPVP